MKNNEFLKFSIKNNPRYYFDDRIKIEDFDLENTLLNEK